MKYVLLITQAGMDGEMPDGTDPESQAMFQAYAAHTESLRERGVWLGGEALESTQLTTQVSVREGETLVVDGPLAETAEQVSGYYLVDCRDLDEAIEIAAGIPGAAFGTIEVRPVWEYEAQIQ